MTDTELRDLFHDAAPSLARPDPSAIDRAWRAGSRRRLGARAAVIGSIAATAAAVTGIAMLDLGSPSTTAPASQDPSDGVRPLDHTADLTVGTTSMWLSPTPERELALPDISDGPVPTSIDLSADAPSATEQPLRSAVAALAPYGDEPIDRLLLIDPDGERRWLDLTALVSDGDRVRPVTPGMLAPDGTTLIFPQAGHLMRFDIPTGEWRRLETGTEGDVRINWASPRYILVMTEETGGVLQVFGLDGRARGNPLQPDPETEPLGADAPAADYSPYGAGPGRGVRSVLSWVGGDPVIVGAGSAHELMVVSDPVRNRGLLFSDLGERWLQCCPVVGWLDDDTVVYESRKSDPQLVAWTIGRDDFASVTRITHLPPQTSYVASWALSAD